MIWCVIGEPGCGRHVMLAWRDVMPAWRDRRGRQGELAAAGEGEYDCERWR